MDLPREKYKEKDISNVLCTANFDVHSPIPLYHQAYSFIKNLISNGYFQVGDLLPSEIELAETLKVGRQTIRQALSNLVNEGLIERFPGKGTFIKSIHSGRQFFLDKSFSQQMIELGRDTYSDVLEKTQGVVDENTSPLLISKIGSPFLKLKRLRYGDNYPIGIQTALVITEKCPDLVDYDFTRESLFYLLSDVYHLKISEIFHTVNAVIANDRLAKLLDVDVGDPLLIEKAVTYLANGEPVETTTSFFRADQYEYSVQFKYSKGNSNF